MSQRLAARGAFVACALILTALGASSALAATPPRPSPATQPPAPPPLGAQAAALIEASTGQQLYGDNANAERPIASTTKLMTALVTLHHARLDQMFADPAYYPAAEDSQIGLVPGERMSVHDLLLALLLPSADDAAVDLAYNVGGGSVARFLGMMNARARELGLRQTHYTTPSGLDTPGNYSSAHDLVLLARYLLRSEPFFAWAVHQQRATLTTGDHVRVITNLNDLLSRYAWINGVKTGHTLGAGYVLVASGTQHGMTLIDAVLGTDSEAARDSAALTLLDYGFATYALRTPVRAGQLLARAAVTGRPGKLVRLIAGSTYTHVFARTQRLRVKVKAPATLTGPLPRHAVVGSIDVLAGPRIVARLPLLLAYALPDYKAPSRRPSALVVSVTLSALVMAAGAAIALSMFWRASTRG